jgi:LL-diaminopimelate aminotransferase
MLTPNLHYAELKDSYLFARIAEKTAAYCEGHPGTYLLRMGIGDVSQPLCPAVIAALHEAVEDQAHKERFHGYLPECGAPFLRESIAAYYGKRGVAVAPEEVFVSGGASDELGHILDLFDPGAAALIPEPAYPAYVDANVMSGRRIAHLPTGRAQGFLPEPEAVPGAELIYLCSPNNPTGAVYTRAQLRQWVEYAHAHKACIIYDAAYEAYIRSAALPRSIFEIAGAETCAIEVNSFSKTAGFTGVRCSWVIVPRALMQDGISLHRLWKRRQATKYNGTSYIVQRGAAAVFTPAGQQQVQRDIDAYMENAVMIRDALEVSGVFSTGGTHAPYVWMQCPHGMRSWDCFDSLLKRFGIISAPGAGFGAQGEGWLRFSSFGSRETIEKAAKRLADMDWDAFAVFAGADVRL